METTDQLKSEIVQVALKQLMVSTEHKRPRMEKVKEYEDVYNGKVKEKLRIQFNVPLPVLPGMVDQLLADFHEPIKLKFAGNHPADEPKIRKIQAGWEKEMHSLRPEARWHLKIRWDKFLAVMSGRSIEKTYGQSDPKFKLNFDVVDYNYFHCEPKGGGLLERHLFCGEEGIFKQREELVEKAKAGIYDRQAVSKLVTLGASQQYKNEIEGMYGEKLNRFYSLGFDPENHNYVGQEVYNLCEWYLTYKGKRWYLLFDPYTQAAVRLEPLKDVFASELYPYTSWATHEDPKVFWSKSYTDDIYPVHDSIATLLNQELTNRQKKNLTARAYDPSMFTNLAALDRANYRPDALVEANTKGGTRQIGEGIYEFKVGDLSGTIELIQWLQKATATTTGNDEMHQQANERVPAAHVIYSNLQSASKRISFKAASYQETYGEIGLRVQHAFDEHLSEPMAVKLMGTEGYGWDYLTRADLKMIESVDAKVISVSEEDRENVLGKDQKAKAIDKIIANPLLLQNSNPKKVLEVIYRDIGGWKDDEVQEFLDVTNYASQDMRAKADIAILQLAKGKTPEKVYDANLGFVQQIQKFEIEHKNQLGEKKSVLFYDYIEQHMPIVQENMERLAGQILAKRKMTTPGGSMEGEEPVGSAPGQQSLPPPTGGGIPQASMTDMQFGGLNG